MMESMGIDRLSRDVNPFRAVYRAAGAGLLGRYRSGGGSHHGAPLGVHGGSDDGGGGG